MLAGLVLLMDIRHPITPFDTQMLEWAAQKSLPVHILLSKADKLPFGKQKATLLQVKKELGHFHLVTIQLFSSLKKLGLDELKKQLNNWLLQQPLNILES